MSVEGLKLFPCLPVCLSIQNLTRIPGKIFQNVSIEGLVIYTGTLEYVHNKAFYRLEKYLTALGLGPPADNFSNSKLEYPEDVDTAGHVQQPDPLYPLLALPP